jgi:separase
MYGESIKSPCQVSFRSLYEEALNWFSSFTSANNTLVAFEQVTRSTNTKLSAKIAIREIRCLLSVNENLASRVYDDRIQALCTDVIQNSLADLTDRAWALYYSADHIIAVLNRSGSLRRIWNGEEGVLPAEDRESLERARTLLITAASIHHIGSDILSRILLRTLALVAGPEIGKLTNRSAGALVLMSIGQSYHQQMIRSLTESEPSDRVERLLDVFDTFDESGIDGDGIAQLLDQLAKVSLNVWKFVAVTLSPLGDVLMTTIAKDPNSGAMSMQTTRVEPRDSSSAYDDIMVPLDVIVQESQQQLHGMDVSAVSERFNKEEAKRKWWDNRHRLDEDLQNLLDRAESNYFPTLQLCMHTGHSIFQSVGDSSNLLIGNLASRFEAVVETHSVEEGETEASLRKLTVQKLKDRLCDKFGFSESTFRKMKKQDLINLYLQEIKPKMDASVTETSTGGCLFLLLDENLHRFPFEGMPSLFGNSVCRVPSLSFVLASLLDKQGNTESSNPGVVDPAITSFVLDPERNLMSTRNRILPILDGIATENNWDWNAAVGEIPPAAFFENGLRQESGLFMYFGHGGAQTCFSRKQVESLIAQRDGHGVRACRATLILMGCSSGRLVSVNRKYTHSVDHQIPLYYEPEGVALSYLCAGAPCVVGNLWDVTDRDIDRYSTTLLELFLRNNDGSSLASCVARSRDTCKLRYLVGCAPVCYGLPVHLLASPTTSYRQK